MDDDMELERLFQFFYMYDDPCYNVIDELGCIGLDPELEDPDDLKNIRKDDLIFSDTDCEIHPPFSQQDTSSDIGSTHQWGQENDCPPSPDYRSTLLSPSLPPETYISAPVPAKRSFKCESDNYFGYQDSPETPYIPENPTVKHQNRTLRFRRTKDAKLWEFLWDLLEKRIADGAIKWLAKDRGVFKILNSGKVAKLWGDHKRKSNMKYEFMARAIRFYYKSGIMSRIPNQRLTYQFGPVAFDLKRSGR